jgi:predicted nucleic acid-binding protein
VREFLDTSVLVATFYGDHEHHEASFALFLRQDRSTGYTAAHCLAEVYSVLTGMPGRERASSDEALLFLGDVRQRLTLVTLDDHEYFGMLEAASAARIWGGAIYDALIARCALKVNADLIYTWNLKHFTRLDREVAPLVKTPDR